MHIFCLGPESDLSSLKIIEIGASPVKRHNTEYLLTIKKDVLVGIRYGEYPKSRRSLKNFSG